MKNFAIHKLLTIVIAAVWMVNGLYCKVLNYVPRHGEIVERILGGDSNLLTKLIGVSEIGMAIWILSGFKSNINATLQIVIILLMNIIEFTLVPDLLLWGKFNVIFALLFCGIIYFNEFVLKRKLHT